MSSTSKLPAYLFTFSTIITALVITYSLSTGTHLQNPPTPSQTSTAKLTVRSTISGDTILLVRDDKLVVDKTCLDYKGLKRGALLIDLYLLEYDNELPFPKKIDQGQAKKGVRLGDNTYFLLSANKNIIKLKLEKSPTAP